MSSGLAHHVAPELLSALLDDELDAAESREVQHHLGSCLHCRQRLDGLRRVAAGLRELERVAVPESLDHSIRRQLALEGVADGLRAKLESRSAAARSLPAHVGLGFTLVLALAVIGLLFTHALERRESPTRVMPLSPAVLEASPREIGTRSFVWQGDAWREASLRTDSARLVAASSAEGRAVLEAEPGLRALLDEAPQVLLEWQGEAIALVGSGREGY